MRTAPARRFDPRRLMPVAGIAPLLLWQLVFFVLPTLLLLGVSFWRMHGYRPLPAFSLHNYAAIFANASDWRSILLSLETAAFVTVACAVLGYPVAYFIAKKGGRMKSILLLAVIAPFWISIVMRAAAWRLLLGDHGVINQALIATGMIHQPLSFLLYSPFATAMGLVYAFLPLYVLPLYAAIDAIHDSWIAAAKDLNAGPFRAFWEVTFPLSLPGLITGAVFCFIFGFGEFVTPALLGGGKQMMLSQLIQNEFQVRLDRPMGSALAVLMLLLVFSLIGISLKWFRRASGEQI